MLFLIVGTRPNYIKAFPVYKYLKSQNVEIKMIHSNQHYDDNLNKVFFDELKINTEEIFYLKKHIPILSQLMMLFKNSNPKIDVVSICTPTFCHYDHLKEIIELKPKLIFCEKPLTENFLKSQEITSLCKKKNIILVVNFLRRWDPFINNFKKDIKNFKYGETSTF